MIPDLIALDAAAADGAISRYARQVVRGFSPTKASSLKALLELTVVYYAAEQPPQVEVLADVLLSHRQSIRRSNDWCALYVWTLAARMSRQASTPSLTEKFMNAVHSTAFNASTLDRAWIEREYSWAYTPLTPRGEEEWRIAMIYKLAFVIELGGSETLPIADAELELQEHLAHLRFLLGIKQARVIERPAGKVPNPIVSHLFEMKAVRGVARSDARVSDVIEVLPDDKGWARCPSCGFRFSIADKHAFDGKRHLRCKQKMRIVSGVQ